MSLRDGTKKMSKSDPSDQSRINLTDDADAIALKIRRAKTDPEPLPSEEKGLDAAAGGRQSRRHLRGARGDEQGRRAQGVRRRAVLRPSRPRWSSSRSPSSAPINAEMKRLVGDPAYIDSVLADGAARAQVIAAETMKAVKDIVGFVRR